MTFKKAEMAKTLRNGLSRIETNNLNHNWLDFAIQLGLALHQFPKKKLLLIALGQDHQKNVQLETSFHHINPCTSNFFQKQAFSRMRCAIIIVNIKNASFVCRYQYQAMKIGKEGGFHGHLVIVLTENKGSEEKLLMNPDIIVIDRSRSYSTS